MTQKHRECDDMADLYEKITEGAYDEGNFRIMTSSERFQRSLASRPWIYRRCITKLL